MHAAYDDDSDQVRLTRTTGHLTIMICEFAADLHMPRHEHGYSYLCMVARGAYLQTAGGKSYECDPGLLLVQPEGHSHASRFAPSGARCLAFQFDHALSNEPAMQRLLGDQRKLHIPDSARLRHQIERELVASDSASDLALQASTLEVIAQACRQAEPRSRREPEWMIRVRERLHDDLGTVPSLQELATLAGVHSSHLAQCFHRAHGVSVGEYLRRLRVERARDALAATRKPIAAIAADAGFADQSHFTRVFHRVTGETPLAWRRRTRSSS